MRRAKGSGDGSGVGQMATQLSGEGGEAGDALRRVQEFDPESLVRESELGKKFAMREAVAPARRVIDLFRLMRPSQITFFPATQQTMIKDQANAFFSLLERIEAFDIEEAEPNPTEAKSSLISQIEEQFQPIFNQIYPLIAFASIRSLDFSELEREARAATQAAKDSVASVVEDIEKSKVSIDSILSEARALAAEQGVSKQAIHFKQEADKHAEDSIKWRGYTIIASLLLVAYAIASLFIHRLPGLDTESPYHSFQIGVSKILIFAVITYVLFLCSRNFLSHKHNEIVNRHRQNALATFTALAEATSDAASSDIVLSHAAACIFSPQETGYARHESAHSDNVPAVQLIPRIGNIGQASG